RFNGDIAGVADVMLREILAAFAADQHSTAAMRTIGGKIGGTLNIDSAARGDDVAALRAVMGANEAGDTEIAPRLQAHIAGIDAPAVADIRAGQAHSTAGADRSAVQHLALQLAELEAVIVERTV